MDLYVCVYVIMVFKVQQGLSWTRSKQRLQVRLLLLLFCIFGWKICVCSASSHVYSFYIPEDRPIGTEVGRLVNQGAQFTIYAIKPQSTPLHFSITAAGVITTNVILDREMVEVYNVTINDFKVFPQLKIVHVLIYVQDINDNTPQFVGGSKNSVTLSEEHNFRYKIIATDRDNGSNATQSYHILTGNVGVVFKLELKRETTQRRELYADLTLNTGKVLDRETREMYVLNISAIDGGNPPKQNFLRLTIIVTDIDDNQPVFSQNNYTASIPENTKPSTSIIQVTATDLDKGTNAAIYYYIERYSDPSNEFGIDKNTGIISPYVSPDYEKKKQYVLTVKAENTDSSKKLSSIAKVTINILDVNDNAPVVDVYFYRGGQYQVYEDANVGDKVASVSVTDADDGINKQVNVTLEGGDGFFSMRYDAVNEKSIIEVGKPLDRETKNYFILTAFCVDNGKSPLHTKKSFKINVGDINDNFPKCDRHVYTSRVFENATVNTSVASVHATDADYGVNAKLVYSFANSILNTVYAKWFSINSSTGAIRTAGTLDREKIQHPVLVVVVSDEGKPALQSNCSVVVNISDTNDNDPIFNQSVYRASILEESSSNSSVLSVYARDPDLGDHSLIKYSIEDSRVPFQIDPDSGAISTIRPIDRETSAMFAFRVIATDGGGRRAFSTVQIIILDMNDNAPVFQPDFYFKEVKEDLSVNSKIVYVAASDKDQGVFRRLTYRIISGNDDGLFAIDPSFGKITLAKNLDRETKDSHVLKVRAIDGGGKTSSNIATVNITVLDVNDDPPVFQSPSYNFTIVENSQPHIVGSIIATSKDLGTNSHVTYSIIHGNDGGHFTINSTGTMYLCTPVDREKTPQLNLTIQAKDGGKPALYGYTHVIISVTDLNDNTPRFNGSILAVFMPENSVVGAPFYQLHAVDADSGSYGSLTYTLVSNPGQLFHLHKDSGDLSLRRVYSLNSDGKLFSLVARAEDGGGLSTDVSLNVSVVDVNDHAPVFANSSYVAHVSESQSALTNVVQVSATDDDSGSNAQITYRFKDATSKFGLKPDGWVYLKTQLDREERETYKLTVIASDQGLPTPLTTSAHVTIIVDDVNDNNPIFRSNSYIFYILEDKPKGTVVDSVSASDKDEGANGKVTYSFETSLPQFTINKDTGEIRTTGVLDREKKASYTVTVVARDGGASSRHDKTQVTIVILDVNDNSPIFNPSQYNEKVYEDVAVGYTVVKVTATDNDESGSPNSNVCYSIVAGQQSSPVFSINDKTGAIYVSSPLDREKKERYILHVDAKDLGTPPKYNIVMVTINILDVNDNPPQFLNMTEFVNVPEKLPVGSNVTRVKAVDHDDGDNGRIEYEIIRGNSGNTFKIDKTTGVITTRILLDFERQNQYKLKISAKDNGQRQHITYRWVKIYVLDANDNRPTFEKNPIITSVYEGVPINHTVKTIQARDDDSGSNSWIWYSIDSQNPEQHFTIDPMSGAVQTIHQIDRETVSEYTLIVRATDQAFTQKDRLFSTATLKIIVLDVNDNKPVFVSRNITYIMEDEPFNFEVMSITAIDQDTGRSGKVEYRIVGGDSGKFTLDPRTGVLKKIGQLDYETHSALILNISATDEGSPQLSSFQRLTVKVVDVNDNPPEFAQKLFKGSVSEGEPGGTSVLRVIAHDRDSGTNAEFTYSFPSGVQREKFRINSTSGWITTRAALDREEQSSYAFVVYATGSTYPFRVSTTNVRVDVLDKNDNPPKFVSKTFRSQIMENSPPHVFFTVVAEDIDDGSNAKLEYRILSGNTGGAFNISILTGELSNARKVDREDIVEYVLIVEAKNVAKPFYKETCQVTVTVQDVNDNQPRFLEPKYVTVLSEETAIGKSVLKVAADDKDAGANGNIVYSLSNDTYGWFNVGSHGLITTESRFDTSVKSVYNFHCFAHDQGVVPKMDVALIEVRIQDMNTHYPVFSKTPYQANVFQNTSAGAVVLAVTATDADTNKTTNGKVSYLPKKALNLFVLESNTGILKTSAAFKNPPPGRHILDITAVDHGHPSKSTAGIIEVLIGTVQDDPPRFMNSSQSSVIIPENTPTGGYVTTLVGRNSNRNPVTYNIISGNHDNAFSINPDSGVLTVQAAAHLDYENIKEYRLQLVATLKTVASLNGYMTLNVRLTDVNDNDPVFHPSNVVAKLPEDPAGGGGFVSRTVVMVMATDADSTSNAQLVYSIQSGNRDNTFTIHETTGQINTAKPVDREKVSTYNLVVKATDRGRTPRSTTCKVKIQVSDVNDNTPVFNVTKEISVREDTRPGSVITMATAMDADLDNQLSYTLKSQSVAKMFAVSRFNGALTLLGSLDFETLQTYSVVVRVSDGKHQNDVSLTIHVTDVNDNPPTFLNSSYQLKITQTIRARVPLLRVTATDKDSGVNGKVTYSLLQPIPEFTINVTSGVISTQKRIEVGIRDALNQILVVATDHGRPSQRSYVYVRILITGEPKIEHAQYTASLSEDVTVGTSVVTVKTTQNPLTTPSVRVSFVIESGDLRNQFRIGQRSGVVRVNSPLDYETTRQYQLVVRAFDDIAPSNLVRVTILINVTDVNDMKPVFRKSHYLSQWKEDVAIGTIVMNVSATDGDSGTNAKVLYAIQSGDDESSFAIDPGTGVIKTVKLLDHDSTKNHHLSVRATDQGTSPLHSEVSVTIQVLDLNDNAPVFNTPNPGEIRVLENSPVSTGFYNLTAKDKDSDSNARLTFTIIGGEGKGLFLINPVTGLLTTNAVFDYEEKSTYSLDVNVKDAGSPPLESNISVIINIASVDEYPPEFKQKGYEFKVPGNAEVGDFVGQVSAKDEDGGEDGVIFYSFVDPTSDALIINSTSGVITVNRTLNDGSQLQQKRQRRSIDFLGAIESSLRSRRRREATEDQIHMTVQADSGKPNSKKETSAVYVRVDFTCPGCGIVTKGKQTGSGITGDSLVIIVALAVLAGVILLALVVVGLIYYGHRKRKKARNKNPRLKFDGSFDEITVHPSTGTSNHGAVSNESIPAPRAFPQAYTPLTRTNNNSNNVTSTEASETPGSASSGRGSSDGDFEEGPPAYVNGDIGSLHSDNYVKTIIADSGIQDNDDDRISQLTISDGSGILHVDDAKPYKNEKSLSRLDFQSQESMHVFGEEGGGEADGGHDVGNLIYAKLAEVDVDEESLSEIPRRFLEEGRDRGPYAGSLSSIIGSKEELTGSYNWDYLLDWGPQFQPLAEVFLEIGRMKDDGDVKNLHGRNGISSIPSSRLQGHLPGISTTDMLSSMSSLPRSPVSPPSTQYTSPAFSPNFTPAITPLITRSPSVSPLDTGVTSPSFTPHSSRPASGHIQIPLRTRTDSQGDSNSELSHSPSISDDESNLEVEI